MAPPYSLRCAVFIVFMHFARSFPPSLLKFMHLASSFSSSFCWRLAGGWTGCFFFAVRKQTASDTHVIAFHQQQLSQGQQPQTKSCHARRCIDPAAAQGTCRDDRDNVLGKSPCSRRWHQRHHLHWWVHEWRGRIHLHHHRRRQRRRRRRSFKGGGLGCLCADDCKWSCCWGPQ